MSYEVIVVGGGIGGLTTAALLAARGVNVCLFERNEVVGGCVTNFCHLGYTFEPTAGLYSGWGPSGIYEKIFSELPVDPPYVRPVTPAYVVRLADHTEVAITDNDKEFEQSLRAAFPECADYAIGFYRSLAEVDSTSASPNDVAAKHLDSSSHRFRSFIDAQLQIFNQSSLETSSYVNAAATLLAPRRGLYSIRGGAEALANVLMESVRRSGGTIRLNAPVLRLAYDSAGLPIGVELLTSETVVATRAIVSNLTVWDTYGKLVGWQRTPPEIAAQLKRLYSWGAYLLLLSMDESASERLPADHVLVVRDAAEPAADRPEEGQFIFVASPQWDPRAPAGKRAVTICTLVAADEWFIFHEDNSETERMDHETLEKWWARLHNAMPELGDSVEVIETASPQTYYERTRRKLGMVGAPIGNAPSASSASYLTPLPNLFVVGDTVSPSAGLAAISNTALALVDLLTN